MARTTTKDFIKTLSSPALARYLEKYVWGPFKVGSIASDLVEEVINRLKKDQGGQANGK